MQKITLFPDLRQKNRGCGLPFGGLLQPLVYALFSEFAVSHHADAVRKIDHRIVFVGILLDEQPLGKSGAVQMLDDRRNIQTDVSGSEFTEFQTVPPVFRAHGDRGILDKHIFEVNS